METNPITPEMILFRESISETVHLTDPRLAKVDRLRLISDPDTPWWDLSYCYGTLHNGDHVRIQMPVWQFPKTNLKRYIVEICKECGVYAKGLGLIDDEVISKCQ